MPQPLDLPDMTAVSVVIPTCNGMDTLPQLVGALRRQTHPVLEIVAVDSGSTDGTVSFLRAHADQVIEIPPAAFNHGATRNLGISHARGDLVVLLVQDAVPASDDWLANLIAPLATQRRLAGTFSAQVARPGASAITRLYLERWMAAVGRPRRSIGEANWLTMAPAERLEACVFDNVSSCIRRAVWQQIPFIETPVAEDLAWALAVQRAGYGVAFAPASVVEHSHDRSARYELARTYVLHRRLFELFELRTIPGVFQLLSAVASSIALHLRCLQAGGELGRLEQVIRGMALAFAWPLGQYAGGLSAARRWSAIRVRGV